jgi:hypothetical protein
LTKLIGYPLVGHVIVFQEEREGGWCYVHAGIFLIGDDDAGANFARVNCQKIFVVTSSTDCETLAPALDEIHGRKSLVQSHREKEFKREEWDHYLSMIANLGEVKERRCWQIMQTLDNKVAEL